MIGQSALRLFTTSIGGTVAENRFRILALDGGGIRGAFSASVLATLEADMQADHGKETRIVDRKSGV